jgi:hypothetical protein
MAKPMTASHADFSPCQPLDSRKCFVRIDAKSRYSSQAAAQFVKMKVTEGKQGENDGSNITKIKLNIIMAKPMTASHADFSPCQPLDSRKCKYASRYSSQAAAQFVKMKVTEGKQGENDGSNK